MPFARPFKIFSLALVAFICGAVVAFVGWRFEGRLKDVPPAPAGGLVDGKFACLSYAPYRDGQSPFNEAFVVPPSQIDEDLAILATHTACVRTYSTNQGLSEVVPLARRHGLKVLLGAWIGTELPKNEREVESVIRLANAYPETVTAVIVGNEVLLRRDQSADRLDSYIRRVKAAVKVPVTYADVWEFWLRNPRLADDVDFITVHMLPYWEDQPIAVPRALRHVANVLEIVQSQFPGRKLFVGEIGWPSLGRMREDARPSPSDQARFLREFVAVTQSLGVGYNFIEAFDQNWKRASEGTVGGHWGLYDSQRRPKVELAGPVSDDPAWRRHWLIGIGVGLLVLIAGVAAHSLGSARPAGRDVKGAWIFAAGFFAGVCGAVLTSQGLYMRDTALTSMDWAGSLGGTILAVAAAMFAIWALIDRARNLPVRPAVGVGDVLNTVARGQFPLTRPFLTGAAETLVLGFGLAAALALLTDGRYRDFPSAVYLTPALAFAVLRVTQAQAAADADKPAQLLAFALAGTAVATVINEGLGNTQAVMWGATALFLSISWASDGTRDTYKRWRARVANPKTSPTEAGPAL